MPTLLFSRPSLLPSRVIKSAGYIPASGRVLKICCIIAWLRSENSATLAFGAGRTVPLDASPSSLSKYNRLPLQHNDITRKDGNKISDYFKKQVLSYFAQRRRQLYNQLQDATSELKRFDDYLENLYITTINEEESNA